MPNTNTSDEDLSFSTVIIFPITAIFASAITLVILTFIDATFQTTFTTPLFFGLFVTPLIPPATFIALHLSYKYFNIKAPPRTILFALLIICAVITAQCLAELYLHPSSPLRKPAKTPPKEFYRKYIYS